MHKMSYAIQLGNGLENANGFLEALRLHRCSVGHWVGESMARPEFLVSHRPAVVFPVIVSVAELGFKDGGKRSEVNVAAISAGYRFCPAEVGPQYCLQSRRQEPGNHFHIGMEPIVITTGYARAFVVSFHDRNRRELSTDWVHHGHPLPPSCQIMYLR